MNLKKIMLNPQKKMTKETKKSSYIVHVSVKIITLAMFLWMTYLSSTKKPHPKTSYPNVLLGNTPPHFQFLDIIISFPQLSIMPFSHCPIQQIQMYKNKWDYFCDLSFFNLHFCIFFCLSTYHIAIPWIHE